MSLLGGALGGILLDRLGDLAPPLIKKILAGEVGDGQLIKTVIETIAGKADVPVDALPDLGLDQLAKAARDAEPLAADALAQMVESQRLMNETIAAERTEHWFSWAWRPGWMWLLGVLWTYALVLRPIVNAAFTASIEAVDLSMLAMLTTVYVGLYMGGHTIKEAMKK
jgi:hypothetical protein